MLTDRDSGFEAQAEDLHPQFSDLYATLESRLGGPQGSKLLSSDAASGESCYALGVTSAVAGEGKTMVALHLALTAARSSVNRVGLLDLSLGQDDLCSRLGLASGGRGIISVLEGKTESLGIVQLPDQHDLTFIPAGRAPANAAKLARSPRLIPLIARARQMVDLLVVDLPAVATNNALPLAQHMDAVVMVACAAATPRRVIQRALDHVGRERVVGVILNRVQSSSPPWLQKRFSLR